MSSIERLHGDDAFAADPACTAIPPELASAFAEGWSHDGKPLDVRIARCDPMFDYELELQKRTLVDALQSYFLVGYKSFLLVDDVLAWRGRRWRDAGRVLDFASGHGRVTRFVVQREVPRELYVTDILDDAVEFQRRAFGVRGFVSHADPAEVRMPVPFDVIAAISLFSHLPEDLFRKWLAKLASALAPGGTLILSTQGRGSYESAFGKPMTDDYVFRPESESKRLAKSVYGSTYCSETRVRAWLAEASGFRVSAFVPRGLNGLQDVYVVEHENAAPTEHPLRLRTAPVLAIDLAHVAADGGVECAGWAVEGDDGRPAHAVDLGFAGGRELGRVAPHLPRPDVAAVLGTPASATCGFVLRAGGVAARGQPRWLVARAHGADGLVCALVVPFPRWGAQPSERT